MMKNSKEQNRALPELRFPEFRDSEGWKETPLHAIGNTYGGLTGKTAKDFGQGEPYLTYKQIFGSSQIDLAKCEYVSIENNESQNTVETGDVLITMSSETAEEIAFASTLLDEPIKSTYLNSFCFGYRVNDKNKFKPPFLRYLFRSPVYRKSVGILAQGATRYNISKVIFNNLKLFIPYNEDEQAKIAECFSSLDDLISVVTDKIEVLKEHKKGLMQQLFPAEGSTVPTRRFPEFQNAPEWESKTLSDVCKLVRGPFGGALKKEIFIKEGYAVYEQSHAIHGDMNIFRYYISEDKFNELIRFSVCTNDIIMSCSGTMGKFSIIPNNHKAGVINQALLKLSTKKGYDYRFIKVLLELPSNQEQLLSESAGGAIKNVASVGQIKEMLLCMPKLNEQQKIADCLSSIDDQISAETQKLDQLKAHKKGLMQRLFPNE